ncbi:MAG: efflux RND transporter periplasmic adaptor subunit [Planctomycetes bacterium]|nr:efflux RND transporter periplasmic adaptor subunit [Planctomycetota bacterium]
MKPLVRRPWFWVPVLALAVAAGAWMYLQARQARTLSDPEQARRHGLPIPVRTALVSEAEVEEVIGATALTVPSQTAIIQVGPSHNVSAYAPTSAITLKALHVHEGDAVSEGQVLAEVEDRDFTEFLKQQEAALASARAAREQVAKQVALNPSLRELELTSARDNVKFRSDDLENRAKELEIFSKLYKGQVSSALEYYDSKSKYVEALYQMHEADRRLERARDALVVGPLQDQQELAKAAGDYETARVSYEVARRDLDRLQLKSPLNGVVDFPTRTEPVAGEIIPVNTPLMQVVRLDPIFVQLDYPQERLDDLFVGTKAEVVLDSFPRDTFEGTVVRISPLVNAQLRVVPVLVELANPQNRIKAGVSGFARLHVKKKARMVPAMAVVEEGGKGMAFRVEDGRARLREVKAGNLVQTGMREVLSGLNPGDEVVIFDNFYRNAGNLNAGNGYLQDGDLVDADWRKWARRE